MIYCYLAFMRRPAGVVCIVYIFCLLVIMENAVTTVVIKQLVFTYRGAIVKLVFCVMVRVTVHGLPQAWATGEGHLPSPRKCTSLDSLHFDSHKKNQNRCHSHQISSLINQRLVALSLSLTINTSVDNSWSDFQSDHTWSLVFWKYTVFQKTCDYVSGDNLN